ncbi:MAG: zeta toxin family protein, partial [Burkholderiales bacterium]
SFPAMATTSKPRLVILAGPNGAGKTTVSKYLLPDAYGITEFVNADRIASGLSAFAPEAVAFEAGRIMLKRIDALLTQKASFAFETTLASKAFTKLIARAQADGYRVGLIYVALPTVQLAKRRVAARVREGGHSIPDEVIERRFFRSLANLIYRYRPLVDDWIVYDNSAIKTPTLVAQGIDKNETIFEERKWQRLLKLATVDAK